MLTFLVNLNNTHVHRYTIYFKNIIELLKYYIMFLSLYSFYKKIYL